MKAVYLILAFVLLVFCFSGAAQASSGTCQSIKGFNTKVNFNLELPDPVYDMTKRKKDLTGKGAEAIEKWLAENGMKTLWKADDLSVAGLAAGGSGLAYGYAMKAKKVDSFGTYWCAYFTEINIDVIYRTIIFVAEEYTRNKCQFNHVHEHELRHHIANQKAFVKYLTKLQEDLPTMIEIVEDQYVTGKQVQDRYEEMKQSLVEAIEIYVGEYIRKEMKKLNDAIDTPEEYETGTLIMDNCRRYGRPDAPQKAGK